MLGTSYGQKRPPLTHILQSILDRYPDGGQILKVFNDYNNQTVDSSSDRKSWMTNRGIIWLRLNTNGKPFGFSND